MKFDLSPKTLENVSKIRRLLEMAADLFFKGIPLNEQDVILGLHSADGSLNHCLRWGPKAAEEVLDQFAAPPSDQVSQDGRMERSIKISYHWECAAFPDGIPQPLAEHLEESAENRIVGMMKQGYNSGELLDEIIVDIPGHETPEDGFECRGWFEIEKASGPDLNQDDESGPGPR